jgi:hypothetical protein
MTRLSALGSRRILGSLCMKSRFFRTQVFLLYAAAMMVIPLGSKSQAKPAACGVNTPEAVAQCLAAICAGLPGGCSPANYQNFGKIALQWMGPNWRSMYQAALDGAHPDLTQAMPPTSIWNQLYRFNNMVVGSMRPALASVGAGATAAVGAAQATGVSIAGATTAAMNSAGAAAAAAGNAVAGAGAATVVAGGVAVVGGAAVVTLTGMLAYESVRWRYAAVESERLEVQACQAVYTTNQQLYNHFLQPGTAAPSRGQCQSFSDFFLRCSKHIVGGPALMQPPGCI